jgi:hypothetical protein
MAAGCRPGRAFASVSCRCNVNRELDQRCLELALADLRPLEAQQRHRALAQFRAIDPQLAERLQLELAYSLS